MDNKYKPYVILFQDKHHENNIKMQVIGEISQEFALKSFIEEMTEEEKKCTLIIGIMEEKDIDTLKKNILNVKKQIENS